MLIVPQNWAENVANVRSRIAAAAQVANRDPAHITLVAVSKGHPIEAVRAVHALGVADFGENYPQEAQAKIDALPSAGPIWHFIGKMQSNKTRPIAAHFAWVHGIDRIAIARRLHEQRPYHAPALQVCLQVKLADEPGKAGVAPDELAILAREVARFERLQLRGLMCLPPPTDDVATQRMRFRRLRELRDALNDKGHSLDVLSMGMSGDFEAAIAEGATHVRVGTAIFGARPDPKQKES
ncbi:MAG TPA: YggS family pyridoxal phosphate-dependent enzyme [Steroidobacteraceae bacterium]|nr:YggS family pyridoxal phosphate-dependent enzyme [Steroidobacteraceae bacterium]